VNQLEDAQRKTAPTGAVTGRAMPGSIHASRLGHIDQARRVRQVRRRYSDITQGVDAVANQQTVDSAIPVGPTGTPADHKRGQLTFTPGRRGSISRRARLPAMET